MTGYESKRAAARDKLDDDDTQVYKDHGDALTIAYQSGYYDGKKAAAQEPTTGNILMDSYKAMQSMKVEGPHHVVCQCDRCKQPAQEPWRESASDYERGVIDGRQMQAQSSVDKAVNAMTQPTYYIPSKDQRPWVGLTDKERQDIALEVPIDAVLITEAKLKDKNT